MTAHASQWPRVLLLRDLPIERRLSMERFADELETGLEAVGVPVVGWAPTTETSVGSLRHRMVRFGRYHHLAHALHGRADVTHVIDHAYGDLLRAMPHGRTVVTCHDLLAVGDPETGSARMRRRVAWSVASLTKASHVVCDCSGTRDGLVSRFGVDPARTSVVPLGVSGGLDAGPAGPAPGSSATGPMRVLHVDTGQRTKRREVATATVVELRRRGHDAILVRLGPTDDVAASVLGPWAYEPAVAYDEQTLADCYRGSSVLLAPSRAEGFGLPLLEAMACGTPVVATRIPPFEEWFASAARLVDRGAHEIGQLADAVEDAARSGPKRQQMQQMGLAVARRLTWRRCATCYLEVYESVRREFERSGGGN